MHPGNILFLKLVAMHKGRYTTACRREKREIAKEIFDALRAQKLRFLRHGKELDGWYEVTVIEAIEKVCHALRRKESPLTASSFTNLT